MSGRFEAYARARAAVLEAQANMPAGWRPPEGVDDPEQRPELPPQVQELAAAHAVLRAAEATVQPELDAAWERNRQAVQDAKAQHVAARRRLAMAEVAAAKAARKRNPMRPVLSEAEMASVEQEAAAVRAAADELVLAQVRFKSGVTAEQMAQEAE